jgi:hypothetical protein
MTDENFATQRRNMGTLFTSVAEIADSHLKGNKSTVAPCEPDSPQASNPARFDRLMNGIGAEERQSPRVR